MLLLPYRSITGTIMVGARGNLAIECLVQKTGGTILGLSPPHMNFVWKWATGALIDMMLASFRLQVIYRKLCPLLPFNHLTIYLHPKDTSEPLTINNICPIPF